MKEKQIEEMAKVIGYTYTVAKGVGAVYPSPKMVAIDLYEAGYRKQSEGEWIWTENGDEDYEQFWICSVCNEKSYIETKFCSECGAKMKGERDV